MCTVTFLPKSSQHFILTSNRDESKHRTHALAPDWHTHHEHSLLFPKDPQGSGSWIAANEQGQVRCLLNGAFEFHQSEPPYKHSRGLVVLDSFRYDTAQDFANWYDFKGIEPFTLVWVQAPELAEIRWDGNLVHYKPLPFGQPNIWSSATLYTREIRTKREKWFAQWLEKHDIYETDAIRKFHKFGGDGDQSNDLIMSRGQSLQTVSITSVIKDKQQIDMIYEDLLNKEKTIKAIPYTSEFNLL